MDDYPVYQAPWADWALSWNQFAEFDGQRMCFWINTEGNNSKCSSQGSMPFDPPAAPTWHHLTVTLGDSGAGREVKWYVDGELLEAVPSDQPSPSDTASKPLFIGGPSTNSELFQGKLDELRIANVARSAEWVRASYRSQARETVSVGAATLR